MRDAEWKCKSVFVNCVYEERLCIVVRLHWCMSVVIVQVLNRQFFHSSFSSLLPMYFILEVVLLLLAFCYLLVLLVFLIAAADRINFLVSSPSVRFFFLNIVDLNITFDDKIILHRTVAMQIITITHIRFENERERERKRTSNCIKNHPNRKWS